jgi:hypothetical protein
MRRFCSPTSLRLLRGTRRYQVLKLNNFPLISSIWPNVIKKIKRVVRFVLLYGSVRL